MVRNSVVIAPCTEQDIPEVNTLKVKPFQKVYCDLPSKILSENKEGVSAHVIKKDGNILGMFCVNTGFYLGFTFARFDTPGISSFMIDQDSQGKGFGTEACRMMPVYLRTVAPRARGSYMLVTTQNAGAYKAFTRGGWVDTGDKYTLGHTGPQHILWLAH